MTMASGGVFYRTVIESAAVYLCYYVQRIMCETLFTSGEADTRERPITTDTSMHRWVGAALSGALKPKRGVWKGEEKGVLYAHRGENAPKTTSPRHSLRPA